MFITWKQMVKEGLAVVSRTQWDREEKVGRRPKRVPIGRNRVAWLRSEIEAFYAMLIQQRDAPGPQG